MKQEFKYIIGVDEAGRGPLAGPVSVGLVIVSPGFDWVLIPGVSDSKKVSEKNREVIFNRAKQLQSEGHLRFVVEMVSAKLIDKIGISPCIKNAIEIGLGKLMSSLVQDGVQPILGPADIMVKLDGSLSAPAKYIQQETIIKGDAKEKVIGLASIMAKVTRDHYMQKIATKTAYQNYDFARHKGYGTKQHCRLISGFGLSAEHRQSYCKNIKMC